tara:strand:- start:587 stop:808 length:222 start_codon:yes stop_codon:yes gene_type:complete
LKKNKEKESLSFEKQFDKLQNIVSEIESVDNNLEKMISLFEEGMLLSDKCEKKINEYRQKINLIVSNHKKEID